MAPSAPSDEADVRGVGRGVDGVQGAGGDGGVQGAGGVSSGPTRRQAAKERRRQQIVESAKKLFARQGFRAVSIDDIGAGADISGPAVYRHFESKEALLAELLVGISKRLHAGMTQIVRAHTAAGSGGADAENSYRESAPRGVDSAGADKSAAGENGSSEGTPTGVGSAGIDEIAAGDGAAMVGGENSVDNGVDDPRAAMEELLAFHVEFAVTEPELIRIQDRDFESLQDADRKSVRRLQREYMTGWEKVLVQMHPDLEGPGARVLVQAVIGMLNSTPYVVRRLDSAVIEERLREAARAALRLA